MTKKKKGERGFHPLRCNGWSEGGGRQKFFDDVVDFAAEKKERTLIY